MSAQLMVGVKRNIIVAAETGGILAPVRRGRGASIALIRRHESMRVVNASRYHASDAFDIDALYACR